MPNSRNPRGSVVDELDGGVSDPENWLLSAEEVRLRLGVSDPTLRREIQVGHFPRPLKIGRAKRWRLSWLQDYLKRLEEAR